jgi:hypothetical protein
VTPEKTPENDEPVSPPEGDPPRSDLPTSEASPPEPPPSDEAEVAAAASASDEAVAAPPSDEPAATPAVEEPARRAGWPAMAFLGAAVLGAAIALAVGAVASLLLFPRDDDATALEARLGALELKLSDLARPVPPPPAADTRAVDEMAARIAKLEAVGGERPPAAGDASLGNRLAGLEGEVKALGETIGALGRRADEATAAAREARARAEVSAVALAALTQKVADAPAVARGELETFDQRVAKLERNDQALAAELAKRNAAETNDRAARLALAAAALDAAVDRGAPFAAELAAAKALGADPKALAPLEPFAASGVPSADALGRELAALAPSLRPAPAAPPAREGFLQRLQVNAEKLVRLNPAAEVAGDDAAAVVSRVEARAAAGDLPAALAELGKLPPAARATAEPWIKKAQARAAALEASRRLAAASLAGLGK